MRTLIDKQSIPGEHALMLEGLVGPLEAIFTIPDQLHSSTVNRLAILGHPHSLQGGTLQNKVVTTLARAFKEAGIPSLRLNFRGVGRSAGKYDAGIGESADFCHLIRLYQEALGEEYRFALAGFSFGSYVAYRAAAQISASLLITIAPPVHHFDYQSFEKPPSPWIIFQGDEDEIVPLDKVIDFSKRFTPPLPIELFPQTGHFFHGKLIELRTKLLQHISEHFAC